MWIDSLEILIGRANPALHCSISPLNNVKTFTEVSLYDAHKHNPIRLVYNLAAYDEDPIQI